MGQRTCTFDGCRRILYAKALCSGHWNQQWKGQDLRPLREWGVRQSQIAALIAGPPTDECILVLWPSGETHPQVQINGRIETVGAAALILSGFPRPPDAECCHDPLICNTGRCCNPRHVRWDTKKANEADKVIAGTVIRGTEVNTNVLVESQVREIRALAQARQLTQREIAARYGITQSTVSNIKHRRSWAWLD